jgi:hypothetical protein
VGTATAHLYLHLRVPDLVQGYLPHLFKIPMHPPLFLLLKGHSPATLDSVTSITQRVGTRCVRWGVGGRCRWSSV